MLVATDLDGTIMRSDGSISDRTVAALQRVENAGATLLLVTGRPPRSLPAITERLRHNGLAICANGALLYDLERDAVLEAFPMSAEIGLDLVRRLRAALPDLTFAVETLDGMSHETEFVARVPFDEARRVGSMAEILDQPVIKLLARDDAFSADDLLVAAHEVAGGLAELTHSSLGGLLEISAAGVSKATTLANVCAERGIAAADVAAFGDMPNDLPMLAWAGRSYAVANAHPDVLAAVPRHIASNDEDGVAAVVERWFS
jgi:Cof subfamily protein (haloacid dehalogenase superfamily)